MDERDFELIAVLEKTKNITRASEILFTSQSALSKRISAIEQELGVPLIVRSRYGVHFTPEGEEVRKKTEEAADILRRMREVLDGQRDAICGTIHIGVSVNYALYRFPETLSLYRKKYPQVNTHII
ncbi:MAG: LysR family transcriptional regulator, partial [Fusobacteriaceae bacterium]|nr:LysR family transcriptional regulator [Fusobacteriaceae bacterium]